MAASSADGHAFSPHMKKLYGNSLRKDAGVTKTLRNVAARNAHVLGGVTKSVKEVSGSVEKAFEEAADKVEEFLQRCTSSSLPPLSFSYRVATIPLSILSR